MLITIDDPEKALQHLRDIQEGAGSSAIYYYPEADAYLQSLIDTIQSKASVDSMLTGNRCKNCGIQLREVQVSKNKNVWSHVNGLRACTNWDIVATPKTLEG